MANLNDQQIDELARQLLQYLKTDSVNEESGLPDSCLPAGIGIFSDVDSAVTAARKAFEILQTMSLAKRNEIISSIREKMTEYGRELAEAAHSETGLGRLEDKVEKNKLVTEKTPGTEILTPLANSGDRGLTLMEPAPYGVIGTITPTTNPTSTIICNTIGMGAAGNAVVFNVHPAARNVSNRNVHLLNEAIISAGGPENLVTTLANPTIASAQELMQNPGIRLLVVTGGGAVVKQAMTSGKRAICAGPGNPPVVVDESADLSNAAESIVRGASFDNNIICVDEKEVFVVEKVYHQLLSEFRRHHAMVLNEQQVHQIEKVIFAESRGPGRPGVMEKSLIGKKYKFSYQELSRDGVPRFGKLLGERNEDDL